MKKHFALALAVGLVSTAAFAATTAAVPTNQTAINVDKAAEKPSFMKNVVLKFNSYFDGPSISDPLQVSQPDEVSQYGGGDIEFTHTLTLGYKLGNGATASINGVFAHRPSTTASESGQDIRAKNPYLKLSKGSIFSKGNFNFGSDLRLYLPVQVVDRVDNRSIFCLRVSPNPTYTIDRLTLGLYTVLRYDVHTKDGRKDFRPSISPNASYQVHPKLAATIWTDFGAYHNRGEALRTFHTDSGDFQPGLSWDPTPNINISPAVSIYTADPSWKTSSFKLDFTANIL